MRRNEAGWVAGVGRMALGGRGTVALQGPAYPDVLLVKGVFVVAEVCICKAVLGTARTPFMSPPSALSHPVSLSIVPCHYH